MQKIGVKIEGVSGDFNFSNGKLVCVEHPKRCEVHLCLEGNLNIAFGKIELYHSGLWVDAEATYDDACKLGQEIVRRWNSCTSPTDCAETIITES